MPWIQVLASGSAPGGTFQAARDASRSHLYLTSTYTHTILKWDGSTLTSFAGPTGSSMGSSLTLDVDAIDDVIRVSGAKTTSPSAGVRAQASLPLTGTPSWTTTVADANAYSANIIRFTYGGSPFLTAYLSAPGAAQAEIQRRATWNGSATTVGNLHTGSPDGGIYGSLVAVSSTFAAAAAPIASSNDASVAVIVTDPSESFTRVKRNNVVSGTINFQPQPYAFGGYFVWAVTDGTTSYVETVDSSGTSAQSQSLGAYARISPEIDGAQYATVGLTLYSRTAATSDFVTADDPVPGTSEFVVALTVSPDGSQLTAWRSDGAAYVYAPDTTPTEDRGSYRRMQRQAGAPTKIGFASDFATATSTSTQTGFSVSRVQEWGYTSPNEPPTEGTFWQSEVDTSVDIDFDMGSGNEIAPNVFMVLGRGSHGLDVLGFDVTITVFSGSTSSITDTQFTLDFSASTGCHYKLAANMIARRYWRLRIRGDGGSGGGPVGYFRIARAFFDTLDVFPTNFQATGLVEQETSVTVNGRRASRPMLTAEWQGVGVTSGDFATWNDFRGHEREQSPHLLPSMPLVLVPSQTQYLADEGHLAPRVGWLKQAPPLRKQLNSADPVYSSRIELVSI